MRTVAVFILIIATACSSDQPNARGCDPAGQDRAVGRFDGAPWTVEAGDGSVHVTSPGLTDELHPEPGQRWLVVSNDGSMILASAWLEVGEQLQVTDETNVVARCKASDGGIAAIALPAGIGTVDASVRRDGNTVIAVEAAGRGVTTALTEQ